MTCSTLLVSFTVTWLPSTAVIRPLMVLLSPSAAEAGNAAISGTNAAVSSRCFWRILVAMVIAFRNEWRNGRRRPRALDAAGRAGHADHVRDRAVGTALWARPGGPWNCPWGQGAMSVGDRSAAVRP